jgi:hypothetical protein
MLKDLRDEAAFIPEEEDPPEVSRPEQPKPFKPSRSLDQITHTNDKQRLMLALMLLVIVCVAGVILLVITGKWILPLSY